MLNIFTKSSILDIWLVPAYSYNKWPKIGWYLLRKCTRYYKLWQKYITECYNYHKVQQHTWQEVPNKKASSRNSKRYYLSVGNKLATVQRRLTSKFSYSVRIKENTDKKKLFLRREDFKLDITKYKFRHKRNMCNLFKINFNILKP